MIINGTQRRSPGLGGCTHLMREAISDHQRHSRQGCAYVLLSCMRYIIIQLFERE